MCDLHADSDAFAAELDRAKAVVVRYAAATAGPLDPPRNPMQIRRAGRLVIGPLPVGLVRPAREAGTLLGAAAVLTKNIPRRPPNRRDRRIKKLARARRGR